MCPRERSKIVKITCWNLLNARMGDWSRRSGSCRRRSVIWRRRKISARYCDDVTFFFLLPPHHLSLTSEAYDDDVVVSFLSCPLMYTKLLHKASLLVDIKCLLASDWCMCVCVHVVLFASIYTCAALHCTVIQQMCEWSLRGIQLCYCNASLLRNLTGCVYSKLKSFCFLLF